MKKKLENFMKNRNRIILIFLIFLPLCATLPPAGVSNLQPVIEDTLNTLDQEQKKGSITIGGQKAISTIQALKNENAELRELIKYMKQKGEELYQENKKLKSELKDVARDAGKADAFGNLGYFIIFLCMIFIVVLLLYLVGKGKVRIPGFVG